MYRNKSFNELVAESIRSPKHAQEYLLNLIEGDDGLSVEDALRHTIRAMGVPEFCARAKFSKQNVNNFLASDRKLKPDTLESYLKPFGLKVEIKVVKAA